MARTPEILDSGQAAVFLGVDRTTLYRWRKLRQGPPRKKIGKRYYYVREILKEWLRAPEPAVEPLPPRRPVPVAERARLGGRGFGGTLHS